MSKITRYSRAGGPFLSGYQLAAQKPGLMARVLAAPQGWMLRTARGLSPVVAWRAPSRLIEEIPAGPWVDPAPVKIDGATVVLPTRQRKGQT